MENNGSQGSLL